MLSSWSKRMVVAALATATSLVPISGKAQQPVDVVMALPSSTLTFSSPFLAEDAGFYQKEGLHVTDITLVGVSSVNAVISGSADFSVSTGSVFLRAVAHGQRLLAIANLIDKPLVEMVLRKDVYNALKINDGMSLAERGRLLKGRTIAIHGVGSVIHAWEGVVAARGGLDPGRDVRIAPMDPPAMLGALQTKAVDGFTTSLPFTTEAVVNGSAIMFASAAQGAAPDLIPFPYGLVMTKPETCETNREKCARLVRALAAANRMIRDEPDKALGILSKRFKQMNPTVLATAWKIVAQAHATDLRVTEPVLAQGDKISIEARLLDPKEKLQSYGGLYTDQYLH
jgi:ABC-type nitrate/sulfonate/bicarbonate transport system substrate-binding protein